MVGLIACPHRLTGSHFVDSRHLEAGLDHLEIAPYGDLVPCLHTTVAPVGGLHHLCHHDHLQRVAGRLMRPG